jgi:hypothetical protein
MFREPLVPQGRCRLIEGLPGVTRSILHGSFGAAGQGERHDERIASDGAIRAARSAGARAAPWLSSKIITTPART